MQMTRIERDLLGMRDYPPVVSQLRAGWMFMRRWPVIPMIVLAALIFCGVFAPLLATHDPYGGQDAGLRSRHIPPPWAPEGDWLGAGDPAQEATRSGHYLGTDHTGRDVYSRMLFGARISLVVAGIALVSGFITGTTLGIVSGYSGGWIDEIITRIVDIWQALPFLMVALVCVLLFGQSTVLLLALMAALAWNPFVRVIRSQTLVVKNQPFVDLARVAGMLNDKDPAPAHTARCHQHRRSDRHAQRRLARFGRSRSQLPGRGCAASDSDLGQHGIRGQGLHRHRLVADRDTGRRHLPACDVAQLHGRLASRQARPETAAAGGLGSATTLWTPLPGQSIWHGLFALRRVSGFGHVCLTYLYCAHV